LRNSDWRHFELKAFESLNKRGRIEVFRYVLWP
jgi:hypothetical protein